VLTGDYTFFFDNHMLRLALIFIAVTVEVENCSIQETPTPNNNCVSNIKQKCQNIEPTNNMNNQIPGYWSIYTIFQVFL